MRKIGDQVYVHGYIDEIRKDTIIIRNAGGYFGTVEEEIVSSMESDVTEEDVRNLKILNGALKYFGTDRFSRSLNLAIRELEKKV